MIRRPLTGAAFAVAVGLSLTGCTSSGEAAPAAHGEALPVVPREANHLHGLGIDPADGRLLLGTHAGLMVVEAERVGRVGSATIDLMGFAVAGPGHFYASGHPGAADDLPDPVGLIESTDGGQTWSPLSLAGISDFHTLAAGEGRVYGFDGTVKATDDGRTWTEGAGDVRPASFAVQPGQPETVLATTEHGPVRSTDGGVTFTHVEGAPLLVFLSWTGPESLWAVAPDGAVHHSADAGTTWHLRGQAGAAPEAFTAAGNDTVVVATAEDIRRSDDAARTFAPVARRG